MTSETIRIGGEDIRLVVRRHPRARALRLSIDPRDGALRLTLPPRARIGPALRWARSQETWIATASASVPPAVALVDGAIVPIEGEPHAIRWARDHRRAVVRQDGNLLVGGPLEAVGGRMLRWLRGQALRTLDAESRAFAARARVTIGTVAVGDPRSRWASCARSGDMRYSWRLIMAPPAVRHAVVAHEVAHRLHMDHSPAFHRAVAAILGREPKDERAWLREHGAELHRIGRDR